MGQVITLEARVGGLRLEADDGWCRCWLADDAPRYLGADAADVVLTRLLEGLERPDEEIVGELAGAPVRWVLALGEAHSTLYAGRIDGDRVLYVQDQDAQLVGELAISDSDWEGWRKTITDALAGLRVD